MDFSFVLLIIPLLFTTSSQAPQFAKSTKDFDINEAFWKCMEPPEHERREFFKNDECVEEQPPTGFWALIKLLFGIGFEQPSSCDPIQDPVTNSTDDDTDVIDLSYLGNRIYGLPNKESGDLLAKWSPDSRVNPEEVGTYAEGDLLITNLERNGVLEPSNKWKDGIVPFVISDTFSDTHRQFICNAMSLFHHHTCIKFIPKRPIDKNYVLITNQHSGCFASVGYWKYRNVNQLNLQVPGCLYYQRTIIHELMHTLGFLHEQSRADRDDHVTIMTDNIQNEQFHNFDKVGKYYYSDYGVDYDYTSILHYSAYAFSKNGQPTIVPKRGDIHDMGRNNNFTRGDIIRINRMYNCLP